jgi:hypothetical protein
MKLDEGRWGYAMHTKYLHLLLVALQPWWVGSGVQANIHLMCIAIYSTIANNIMTLLGLLSR